MAFKANNTWRSMMAQLRGNRSFATAAPNMKQFAHDVRQSEAANSVYRNFRKFCKNPASAPILVLAGFTAMVMSIGTHSLYQQIRYAPMVLFNKQKRESLHEVSNPDVALISSDNFINNSFLRKVGHIQEPRNPTMPDAVLRDPYSRRRNAETLKAVGVEPAGRP